MGQVGQGLSNPNVTNPQQAQWGDLDTNEKLARVGAQGARGLANGMQNYQGQQSALQGRGGFMPSGNIPQTPMIQPQIFNPQGPGTGNNGSIWPPDGGPTKRGSNPYFYGYGQ